jgi:hypothetical protein
MNIHEQFDLLTGARWWESVDGIATAARFLDAASEPGHLRALLSAVTADPVLSGLSERLRSLDKIVLLNHPATRTRLRLHHFRVGTYDLMHNHKWPFYSKILKGHLVQELFEAIDATPPQFVSSFDAGSGYFLGPHLFHKLRAQGQTITLVLRGPDMLPCATWRDVTSGDVWQHVGGKADDRKVDFDAAGLGHAISEVRAALGDG